MANCPDLGTPIRKPAGKGAFETQPRKVDAWLENLPRANVGECARRIFDALTRTNRQQFRYRHRIHLLEALREPVATVSTQMRKHFIGSTYPLPEKAYQIASATRELNAAMATGYKIAIEDLIGASLLMIDNRTLLMLMHRAMTYMTNVLLISYQAYSEFPADTWSVLHRLYAFAEKKKLHRVAVADEQHQYINKSTVENEYVRALLLFLSSPYHLRHGEIGNVHINLERWFSHTRLRNYTGKEDKGFIIDLEADVPPRVIGLVDTGEARKSWRVLETENIIATLNKEKEHSVETVSNTLITMGMEDAALPPDLLAKLINAWDARTKRRFPRDERRESVRAMIGMTSIHCGLLRQTRADNAAGRVFNRHSRMLQAMFDDAPHFEAQEVKDVNVEEPDVWESVFNHEIPDDRGDLFGKAAPAGAGGKTGEQDDEQAGGAGDVVCQADEWLVVNESAGGLCIQCHNDCISRVQVGELVGIRRETQAGSQFLLGLVRWMRSLGSKGIEAGVMLLAPNAIPVGIALAVDASTAKQYRRGLLLPGNPATQHRASLVTPAHPFRSGAVVNVFFLGKESQVRLGREIGNSGYCAQFHFDIVSSLNRKALGEAPPDDEFGDVWTSI